MAIPIGAAADSLPYMEHPVNHNAMASTEEGVPIINPEIDLYENPPDPSAAYVGSTIVKTILNQNIVLSYELKAHFLYMSPDGKCIETYHAIPSLRRAIGNNPSSPIARNAERAIADLRKMASLVKGNPQRVTTGNWELTSKEQTCPALSSTDFGKRILSMSASLSRPNILLRPGV